MNLWNSRTAVSERTEPSIRENNRPSHARGPSLNSSVPWARTLAFNAGSERRGSQLNANPAMRTDTGSRALAARYSALPIKHNLMIVSNLCHFRGTREPVMLAKEKEKDDAAERRRNLC